jgi:L-ribulose-5-phosphate 3-epimerase
MNWKMNPIGIMQGRLSPPVGGRIQSFPIDCWQEEFSRAREAGLNCIEWVYEFETEAENPLRTDAGVGVIGTLSESSGVAVWSICADFYMKEILVGADGAPRTQVVDHLDLLLRRASLLGVRYMVLPFVDESSLKSVAELEGLLTVFESILPKAQQAGVELHLETDLKPALLAQLLQKVSNPWLRANYDIGNSASLGHDPVEELTLLGPWLGSVHVKDRLRRGSTVPLGTGAADFTACFRLFVQNHFRGPYILQTAREEGLSETYLAMRNRRFVQNQLAAVMASQ